MHPRLEQSRPPNGTSWRSQALLGPWEEPNRRTSWRSQALLGPRMAGKTAPQTPTWKRACLFLGLRLQDRVGEPCPFPEPKGCGKAREATGRPRAPKGGLLPLHPRLKQSRPSNGTSLALTGAAGSLEGTEPKDELALTGAAGSPDGRENCCLPLTRRLSSPVTRAGKTLGKGDARLDRAFCASRGGRRNILHS